MRNLELWQLNLLIETMSKQVEHEINREAVKCDMVGRIKIAEEERLKFEQHVSELKNNKFHPLGKADITLQNLIEMRDNYSLEAERALES